ALTTSIFDHCQFNGGLHLAAVADSIGLTHCVVTQDNGVVLDQIAGAGNFVMQACNVTAARGVVIDGAAAPQIVRNYLETLPGRSYDLKDDALLSMQGTSRIIDGAIIQGNLIGDHNDRGNRYRAIYLNNTLRALVSDNNIYTKN